MTVFATALATLHADANMAEAASFRRPPGAWVAVRVVRSMPMVIAGALGPVAARAVVQQADVMASALSVVPRRGDELRLGSVTYRVEEAEADNLGLSYRLGLAVVDAEPIPVVGTFIVGVDDLA